MAKVIKVKYNVFARNVREKPLLPVFHDLQKSEISES